LILELCSKHTVPSIFAIFEEGVCVGDGRTSCVSCLEVQPSISGYFSVVGCCQIKCSLWHLIYLIKVLVMIKT